MLQQRKVNFQGLYCLNKYEKNCVELPLICLFNNHLLRAYCGLYTEN